MVIAKLKRVKMVTRIRYGVFVKASKLNRRAQRTKLLDMTNALRSPQNAQEIQYETLDSPMTIIPSRRRFSFSYAISFRQITNPTIGGMKK
jgi:hypothetical protein